MTRPAIPGMDRAAALLLAVVLLLVGASTASAASRVALVVGNNAYADQPLFNPVNDARAVSRSLARLGFDVVTATDADLETMQAALLDFTGRIEEGATALVFFAGHGVQARGRNFLVPVDASLESESALRFEALELADVLEELEVSGAALNLVILDACRNNPFLRRLRGASRGLAAVDAATGTLIAYATAPGSVASDGSGDNGLYTEHFLDALDVPGLQAEEVFKRVRIAVADASDGEQIPWESSSLTGDFVFNRSATAALPAARPGPVPPPGEGVEALFWNSAREQDSASAYRAYLARFPAGVFAPLAEARIAALGPSDARDGATRCEDLTGRWLDRRDDRACASVNRFSPHPDEDDAWRVDVDVCPTPGLMGGLSAGSATAIARIDGRSLTIDWEHGPCRGITEIVLDAGCASGRGTIIGRSGGFGTCAAIRTGVTLERASR